MNTHAASQLAGPSAHVTLADGAAGSDAEASSVASRLNMLGGPRSDRRLPHGQGTSKVRQGVSPRRRAEAGTARTRHPHVRRLSLRTHSNGGTDPSGQGAG